MFDSYKNAFISANNTIWWGDENINRTWDEGTMYFYCAIVLLVILFGWKTDKYKLAYKSSHILYNSNRKIRYRLSVLFSILAIVLGCRHYSVGIDTVVYRNTIDNATSISSVFENSTEPLYNVLQYLIHIVIGNGTVGVFLYSVATIYMIYQGLKRYSGSVSLYASLLAYICIYYFPAMNLVRMSFAASIMFASIHFFMEGKYRTFYTVLFLTCMIHYSTAVLLIPLCMYHIYTRNKSFAFCGLGILALSIVVATTLLGDYIALLNRYSYYIENNISSEGIGVMLFVDYLPALYLVYFIMRRKLTGKWSDLTVCFTSAAFVVRLMSYYISAAGRLHSHFMFLTIILLPYWLWYMRINKCREYSFFLILCTLWSLFRLHIYFMGYLSSDGIMPYHTIFYN